MIPFTVRGAKPAVTVYNVDVFCNAVAPVISSVEVNPINEGMSLTIPLTIMANPSPSLVWTLNGQPVDTERGITLSLTSIMFMSVSKQDAGIYIINATNSVGSVTVNFTLDVQCKF